MSASATLSEARELRDSRSIVAYARELVREDPSYLRVSGWSTVWRLCAMLLVGCLAVLLGIQHHPWCWPLAFMLMAVVQYHVLVAGHEALHFGLFRSRRLNEVAGHLVSWYQMTDLVAIRNHHNSHHRHYGFDDDPDKDEHHNFPEQITSQWGASVRLVYNGFFLANLRTKIRRSHGEKKSRWPLLGIAATQASIIGVFVLLGGEWWHYFPFYAAPLLLMSRSFNNLRMFAEHFGLDNPDTEKHDQIFTARTTCDSRPWWRAPYSAVERVVFAPFNFNFHFEHHLMPSIPYPQLPRLHRALREAGVYEVHPDLLSTNYRQTFMSVYDRPTVSAEPTV